MVKVNTKYLMTGPKENSEFFPPRISVFPEVKSRGNKTCCFPVGPVIMWFVLHSDSKIEQTGETAKKIYLLDVSRHTPMTHDTFSNRKTYLV